MFRTLSSALVIVCFLISMITAGQAQSAASRTFDQYKRLVTPQPKNFSAVNLRSGEQSEVKRAPTDNLKTAYWSQCGGNSNVGTCNACSRVTDVYGGNTCISCHSCSTATYTCGDTYPNNGC
jgi:hypothetical protein